MYTLQYFRDKFAAIPDNKWCMRVFTSPSGAHCALGHCMGKDAWTAPMSELRSLSDLLRNSIQEFTHGYSVALVNDDEENVYGLGTTPKQRVLALIDRVISEENLIKEVNTIANQPKIKELCIV